MAGGAVELPFRVLSVGLGVEADRLGDNGLWIVAVLVFGTMSPVVQESKGRRAVPSHPSTGVSVFRGARRLRVGRGSR